MKILHHLALLSVLLLVACASRSASEKSPTAEESGRKSLSDRIGENNGYKQDADGNWKPQADRRSSFEGKRDYQNLNKQQEKQTYQSGDYAKKSWWGNKNYSPKSYTPQTGANSSQKTSALQSRNARETGTSANVSSAYRTGSYGTHSAHESGAAPRNSGASSSSEDRKRAFQDIEIIDWKEQRSLSMEQSKGLLGR